MHAKEATTQERLFEQLEFKHVQTGDGSALGQENRVGFFGKSRGLFSLAFLKVVPFSSSTLPFLVWAFLGGIHYATVSGAKQPVGSGHARALIAPLSDPDGGLSRTRTH